MLTGFIIGLVVGSIGASLFLCFLIGARIEERKCERNMRRMLREEYIRSSGEESEAA